jgi:hypothetical protein
MAKNVAILTKTFVTSPRHSLELDRFDPGFNRFARVIDSFAAHRQLPFVQFFTLAPIAGKLRPGVHRS